MNTISAYNNISIIKRAHNQTFCGKNPLTPLISDIKLLPDSAHCVSYLSGLKPLKYVNFKELAKLNIPNFQPVLNKGVRGESLSSSKNYKFLSHMKPNGIDTIIDLRTADYTPKFKEKCMSFGLDYVHIPIDEKVTSNREILDNMPKLFSLLEKGNFYIACAQGRHRTDIALALNYMFNPNASKIPPKMHGHIKPNNFRCQDIFTRVNSIYKSMTTQDKAMLGWTEQFEKTFAQRKKNLKMFNEAFCHPEA